MTQNWDIAMRERARLLWKEKDSGTSNVKVSELRGRLLRKKKEIAPRRMRRVKPPLTQREKRQFLMQKNEV